MADDDRATLTARMADDGLVASEWSNGPDERYAPHAHGDDKVLVVAAGSIRFGLPGMGAVIDLDVGDRLDLPAGTVHDASVGPHGVTCLEAHRPAIGSMAPVHRRAGTW